VHLRKAAYCVTIFFTIVEEEALSVNFGAAERPSFST